MTKILFFATNFYPYHGGLEHYVLHLAKRLASRGIKVDVLTYNVHDIKEYEEHEGIGIYRIPCYDLMKDVYSLPKFNRKTKEVFRKLEKNNYDFVITQTRFFSTSYLGMRFARRNNIKFIHTEHGNVFVKHDKKYIEIFALLYDLTIGRKIFREADKVIGISRACCNFAKKMGADKKKVYYIPNSVDTNMCSPMAEEKKIEIRKALKIRQDSFIISYVGRLIYAKGLQDLIEAVKGTNYILLLMGQGPYRKKLRELADKYKVKAIFLGDTNHKDVMDYLNVSDIFVNPSYSEGLPTSVLEAGSCGLPVVATNVGGTGEIIDSRSGFLYEPKDVETLKKMINVLRKDKELRNRFSSHIRKKIVREFDWDRNVDRYIKEILK